MLSERAEFHFEKPCQHKRSPIMNLQVKNISMEMLDFYENHRMITEERISAAFNKLDLKT